MLNQPMSSPMMTRMLGRCCWAVATPANSGTAARTATTVHIRNIATTALVFIHPLLSLDPHCAGPSTLRAPVLFFGGIVCALGSDYGSCPTRASELQLPTLEFLPSRPEVAEVVHSRPRRRERERLELLVQHL